MVYGTPPPTPWAVNFTILEDVHNAIMDIITLKLVDLKWLWKYMRKYDKILYIFTIWPYWPRPRVWTSKFHDLGIVYSWAAQTCIYVFWNINMHGGKEEDFLRFSTFSLHNHTDPANGPGLLTQGPWIQFRYGLYEHIIMHLAFFNCDVIEKKFLK